MNKILITMIGSALWMAISEVQVVASGPSVVKTGGLEDFEVKSAALANSKVGTNTTRRAMAYLPPGYGTSARRYPVIYYLPTSFEGFRSAFNRNDGCGFFDREISSGVIEEFLFVCVDIGTPLANSWGANSSVTGNWEDFIVKEVVTQVDSTFKSRPERNSRGIVGEFMGAHAAIRVAMAHPDVFGSVYGLHPVGTGSGVQIMHGRPDWDLLGRAKSVEEIKGNGFCVIFTGIFQAFLPNPDKSPLYVDLAARRDGKRLVVDSELTERLRRNFFLESLIPQHAEKLKTLRGFKFDWARTDQNWDHVYSNQAFTNKLNEFGVPHQAEEYNGMWVDGDWTRDSRFATDVLPFFERHLAFDRPTD
ncbi:alpha/beta hydrolase-fold protein [Singulisphaera rosea]